VSSARIRFTSSRRSLESHAGRGNEGKHPKTDYRPIATSLCGVHCGSHYEFDPEMNHWSISEFI
jgi:hypothetical protein